MKRHVFVSMGLLGLAMPALASAEVKPQTTEQSVICRLSGTCDSTDAPAVDRNASSSASIGVKGEKSFSLFRGVASQTPKSNVPIPHGQPNLVSVPSAHATPMTHRAPHYAAVNHAATHAGRAGAAAPHTADMLMAFRSGSADLSEQAIADAKVFARALQSPALASGQYVVEGHTDSVGGRDYNLALSQRRAQAVMDFLTKEGVPAARLKAQGFGFDHPKSGLRASNPKNRRVQLVKTD
jgi:outer membrane protein OmpA-like peptidoglycan-associated protein